MHRLLTRALPFDTRTALWHAHRYGPLLLMQSRGNVEAFFKRSCFLPSAKYVNGFACKFRSPDSGDSINVFGKVPTSGIPPSKSVQDFQ